MKSVSYYLGRLHEAWGQNPWLVLHHGGIDTDDDQQVGDAIYYLLMACMGHGITIEDKFDGVLDKAGDKLRKEFDPAPFYDEMYEFREAADAALKRHILDNLDDEFDDRLLIDGVYQFESRMGTGDVIRGPGKYIGGFRHHAVFELPENHSERPGDIVMVDENEIISEINS